MAVRYERPRVWCHLLLSAGFLCAVWTLAVHVTEVDTAAAAVLSLLVLAFDGYGTIQRALRRGPIVTLSPADIAVHLPEIDPIPWARVRSVRLGGNWVTGRYLEVCHTGPLPAVGWRERLGFGITAKQASDSIQLNIGCLEQSDRSVETIEAALARYRLAPTRAESIERDR